MPLQPAHLWSTALLAVALAACGGSDGTPPSPSFDIQAEGTNSLMPADAASAKDPTDAANSPSGTTPYFIARSGITVETLKTLMADKTTFPRAEDERVVTIGNDSYKGWRLADVGVRATKFRRADYNTGAFGATTAVIATGADKRKAVFSFTELIRSANGEKTIVAYEKNGSALPDSEGRLAIVAGNDTDTALRKVVRLTRIGVRNEYVSTAYTLPSAATAPALTPADIAFSVGGAVTRSIGITAPVLSTSSTQRLYAVAMVGDKDAGSFSTYHFQEYGPRHTVYLWGQGIRLKDVLDTAGVTTEKNRCFVTIVSGNNQPALFSCGELYNSQVGVGDGVAGAAARSRSKGVLLVTDDLRAGSGNNVMMTCWSNLSNCTKNDAGNPAAYTTAMDANGDGVNFMSVALVSTEDRVPFIPFGRWYPMPANCASLVWQCNAWIDVGERLQQGIKSITVSVVGD